MSIRYFKENLIKNIQDLTCYYCECWLDQHTVTIDHVLAKRNGGQDNKKNLVPCCYACNDRKGSRYLDDFVIIKHKDELPKLDKNGKEISYEIDCSRFGKNSFIKSTETNSVYYNHLNKKDKTVIRYEARKNLLEGKEISCRFCKCFLDPSTLCFYFIGIKKESNTRSSSYFAASCFDCMDVKDKNSIKEKELPTKTNQGKIINW